MIFKQAIADWRKVAPWPDDVQVEQDLILTGMLHALYSDPFLTENIAFRGGTCLNKLFWENPVRYSEDLDFVQTSKGKIGPIVRAMRTQLDSLFEKEPSWASRRDGFRLYYRFDAEMESGASHRIKIEINTREQFSLEGHQQKKLQFKSLWKSGKTQVTTFTLEELLATKLRALYQRRKGRDLFDLWKSQELKPDYSKVVGMCMEYCHRSKKVLYRGHLFKNLEEKLSDPIFTNDLSPLLNVDVKYDLREAADFVMEKIFSFIPESKSSKKRHLGK